LRELIEGLDVEVTGNRDLEICDIAHDSRAVVRGGLFVALRGQNTDGHRYAADAVRAGADALLVEEDPIGVEGATLLRVADTRRALAIVASRFFGEPGRHLTLIGVTGTNGKTSCVRMLESVITAAGLRSGSMGTVSVRYPDGEEPASLTTPESLDIQRSLARMRDAGATHVALEVSSHALDLDRVAGMRFEVAVFTNLTQDHLDWHGDMQRYAAAKARLFSRDHLDGTAVVHAADPFAELFADTARRGGAALLRYARGADADAQVRTLEEDVGLEGARLVVDLDGTQLGVQLSLPGDFQVENALAAMAAGHALGIAPEAIARGIETCPPVPGRLERVAAGRPIVLVDYAHTPDALERVLSRVRPLARGRLITVFGCGGDRDRTKRAPMARAACSHSDLAIATSDNPRTEDPEAILRDVAEGLSGNHETIVQRRDAIQRAVALANEDDEVVIAGKGHEDYQILGSERIHFDDREEARAALEARRGAA
jgi:UDP-N-acetylmuramoyl-L-alanyl-D-glutamate--2,6-diaminopimelate ligase